VQALDEPGTVKAARPVRREAVGKGPSRRDLAGGPPDKNVGETVERVLRRHADPVEQEPAPLRGDASGSWGELHRDREDRLLDHERAHRVVRARFAAIRGGATARLNKSAVARATGAYRHTVQGVRRC
jgi:hypothetical protein